MKIAVFTDSFLPGNGKNGFCAEYDTRKYADKIYEIIKDQSLYKHVCKNVSTVTASSWKQSAEE